MNRHSPSRGPRILGAFIFTLVCLGLGFVSIHILGPNTGPRLFGWPEKNTGSSSPSSPLPSPPSPSWPTTPDSPLKTSQHEAIAQDTNFAPNGSALEINPFRETIEYFKDFEFHHPFQNTFGDQGARTKIVRNWLRTSQGTSNPQHKAFLDEAVENATQALFPFMRKPPGNPDSPTPFADLLSRYERGSTGIVITAGDPIVRFCAHLIVSIRSVLRSNLPIQVFYAGDSDLSPQKRAWLASLVDFGPELEFVDIETVFNKTTLAFDRSHGGWAMKPFAMLASRFEKVILLDADTVLLQPPESFFSHPAFLRSGALLFHDRLIFKGQFKGRHDWWKENIRNPGPEIAKSLVWTENYGEEGDSGVVVLDKSRVDVLMGLMHICWQNSLPVRESITYKITYGDKESYWFGFELTGSTYEFENHYAAMLGWEEPDADSGKPKICSFTIAHLDPDDKLLWYNGGLLKNKLLKGMEDVYEVPNKWMVDAEWVKGNKKEAFSCMRGGEVHNITDWENTLFLMLIEHAKRVDGSLVALGENL